MFKNPLFALFTLLSTFNYGQTRYNNFDNYIKQNGKWVSKPELYELRENNPENQPQLLVGIGLGINFSAQPSLLSQANVSYTLPKFGGISLNQTLGFVPNSTKGYSNYEEVQTNGIGLNLIHTDLNFHRIAFSKIKPKIIGFRVAVTGMKINSKGEITTQYLVARVPASIQVNYGFRTGLIYQVSRHSNKLNISSESFLGNYSQGTLYLGIYKSRQAAAAIDYVDYGHRSTRGKSVLFVDFCYAPMQKYEAYLVSRNTPDPFSSDGTGTGSSRRPIEIAKYPLGYRFGLYHEMYRGNSNNANTIQVEIGRRPTYYSRIYGLYVMATFGYSLGFKPSGNGTYPKKFISAPVTDNGSYTVPNKPGETAKIKQDNPSKVGYPKYKRRTSLGQLIHGKNSKKKVKNRFG